MGAFLEKVVEVSRFRKTEAVADFGDVPVGVLQQGPGFADQSPGDVIGGGLAGCFPD